MSVPVLPSTLVNNTTADASAVMADLQAIIDQHGTPLSLTGATAGVRFAGGTTGGAPTTGTWQTGDVVVDRVNAAWYCCTAGGSPGTWSPMPTTPPVNHYGSGTDGSVTVSTTVTLTRDMHYSSLTVSSGGIINTGNWRIFCTGTVTVAAGGTIRCNGSNGANAGGAGGAGTPNGHWPGSTAGGDGGRTASAATTKASSYNRRDNTVGYGRDDTTWYYGQHGGNAPVKFPSLGGQGGQGGTSGSYGGGLGGSVWSQATTPYPIEMVRQVGAYLATNRPFAGGGTGGGGSGNGGSDSAYSGGAGGGGGGVVCICAATITNAGTIQANGGNGGTYDYVAAGPGGGGGGGAVILLSAAYTNTGTVQALGGSKGAFDPGYQYAAADGAAGQVIQALI